MPTSLTFKRSINSAPRTVERFILYRKEDDILDINFVTIPESELKMIGKGIYEYNGDLYKFVRWKINLFGEDEMVCNKL